MTITATITIPPSPDVEDIKRDLRDSLTDYIRHYLPKNTGTPQITVTHTEAD